MSGQQIGTVVGAVVGSFFGAPQLGAAIGGLIGGAIDPEQIKGPHIGEANAQTSADGQAIAWILGTAPCVGNIMDAGPRYEVSKTDDGKGGPEVTTYEAHQSFAVLICESCSIRNSLITGIQMVKANGKIVYDVRPGSTMQAESAKWAEKVTFYYGGEDPPIDPTLEAIHGVGNTPGYPGICYAVFRDFNRTEYGDAIPTFEWVVVSEGTQTDETCIDTVFASPGPTAGVLYTSPDGIQWAAGQTVDTGLGETPKLLFSGKGYVFALGDNGVGRVSKNRGQTWQSITGLESGVTPMGMTVSNIYFIVSYNDGDKLSISQTGDVFAPVTVEDRTYYNCAANRNVVVIGSTLRRIIRSDNGGASFSAPINVAGGTTNFEFVVFAGNFIALSRTNEFVYVSPAGEDGTWEQIAHPLIALDENWAGFSVIGARAVAVTSSGQTMFSDDGGLNWVQGGDTGVLDTGLSSIGSVGPAYGSLLTVGVGGEIARTVDGDTWAQVWTGDGVDISMVTGIEGYPPGWTPIPDAPGFYVDENGETQSECTPGTVTSGFVLLSDIISRVNVRGGLTIDDFDVTELTDEVLGYPVLQQYSAADTQRPLLGAYFAFGSEYDGTINYHKHGQDAEITIDPDEFIEGEEEVDNTKRRQAIEFPRKLYGSYYDPDLDFAVAKQPAERTSPDVRAIGEQTFQIPVVMEHAEAAQVTEKSLKVMYAKLHGTRKFSVPYGGASVAYLRLVPGMPFILDSKRWTADQLTLTDGVIALESSYDRQSAFTSDVQGIAPPAPTAPPSGLSGPTIFAAMNLPRLRTQDNVPGMYIAVTGILPTWRGCEVQLSIDGGVTFVPRLQATQRSVMGVLTEAISSSVESSAEPISVRIQDGVLVNATAAEIAAGGNAFAINSFDNISEIGQFQTQDEVTPNNYELTDVTRGVLGTTDTDHALGEQFVMLSSVYFLPLDSSLIGLTLIFRPVSYGSPAENSDTYTVIFSPQFTGPEVIEFLLDETGDTLMDETGAYLRE